MEKKIKVLVVDDSIICRELLSEILGKDPGIELVGIAGDGKEAVDKTKALKPDLITMDLKMPVMDGIEATQRIMADNPTPILILTAHPFQSGVNMTFKAIEAGALDLVIKPELANQSEIAKMEEELRKLIRFLSKVTVVPRLEGKEREKKKDGPGEEVDAKGIEVVAFASSAGGPGALHAILKKLPEGFPAAILIVQHIAEGFTQDFASWLDSECDIPVKLAEDGDEILPGRGIVAPAGEHMRVMSGGIVKLIKGLPIGGYRPSANVLFSSVARNYGRLGAGVMLTGMGNDGVAGFEDIKKHGGFTIVQDEGSSIVYGMPKEAIDKGVVDCVADLERIPSILIRITGEK